MGFSILGNWWKMCFSLICVYAASAFYGLIVFLGYQLMLKMDWASYFYFCKKKKGGWGVVD